MPFKVFIDLATNHFPFMAPKIVLNVNDALESHLSQFDIRQATFEDIMKEHWHPSIRLVDIAEKSMAFCERSMMPVEQIQSSLIRRMQGIVGRHESGAGRRDPILKLVIWILMIKLVLAVVLSLSAIDP